MSAAFQLDFTPEENNERLAAAVTSYGVGTRSYNRSAEKREMDRQRAEATARYQEQREASIKEFALSQGIPVVKRNGEDCIQVSDATFEYLSCHHQPILAPLSCSCAQRPYPHDLSAHRKLFESPGTYEAYEVRIRFAKEGMRWPWSLRFAPEMEA